MRECNRHPSESQPGGGVCASCLEERLIWLWRGESFRHDAMAISTATAAITAKTATSLAVDASSHPKLLQQERSEPAASRRALPSLASVREELHVLGIARRPETAPVIISPGVSGTHSDPTVVIPVAMAADPAPPTSTPRNSNSRAILDEWTAFHARRRATTEPEPMSPNLESPRTTKSSRSFDSVESFPEPGFSRPPVHPDPELRILMNAQKMRSQSMPLDFRSAEETAARVISEQADFYLESGLEIFDFREGDGDGDGDGAALGHETRVQEHEAPRCFSPVWHSPKWVKVLASPMTSRNRVFPSRSKDTDVRKKARSKRGPRFISSDWGFKNASGGASPLRRGREQQGGGGAAHSVFSWLQDAETIQYKKRDPVEQQLTSSSSSSLTNSVSTDSWLRDLTTVGHLHEIAEELEIVEESSEEEDDDDDEEDEGEKEVEELGDVSSFGKFLLQAAQRHPHAQLTRLVSAPASEGL